MQCQIHKVDGDLNIGGRRRKAHQVNLLPMLQTCARGRNLKQHQNDA